MTPLRRVRATRYAVPLREGGSMPGLVEADDLGMYVVKMRGAGQGLPVLVAEVLVGEIGRALRVAVPELVEVDLCGEIARFEADEEVQDLLTASVGLNLGMDYLPGAFGYDGSQPADRDVASLVLWLDAFTANVDRTWANPNLLRWGGQVWAIDHGAALWFHHAWARKEPSAERFAAQPFDASAHVLRDLAGDLREVHEQACEVLTTERIAEIAALVPDEWLVPTEHLTSPAAMREEYVRHLELRLASPAAWLPGSAR